MIRVFRINPYNSYHVHALFSLMVWTRIVDSISSGLAFFPPTPPSYRILPHGDGNHELYIEPIQPGLRRVPKAEVTRIPVGDHGAQSIVAAYIPAPNASSGNRFTILHSHGNAVDLGQMMGLYAELARVLRVNILAYDYRGYGLSDGRPAASSTLVDISTALELLLERYNRTMRDIVLYGQSVGTGPTSWLAAKSPQVAGVVLHSPFLSGLRVIRPVKRWPSFVDIFPNIKYVPKIEAPLLILHGSNDEVIDISHGRELYALSRNPVDPLWAEGSNHHDVEAHPGYIPKLREFLVHCFGEEYAKMK